MLFELGLPLWLCQSQRLGSNLKTHRLFIDFHRANSHDKKGESVGYNQGWIAPKDSRIAVLPLGHADGIQRALGHEKGGVWIRNQWAPIIGNVCMDLFMVDISEVNCSIDDRAVLFDQTHPANVLAEKAGTISYELFTGLGQRIGRYNLHLLSFICNILLYLWFFSSARLLYVGIIPTFAKN